MSRQPNGNDAGADARASLQVLQVFESMGAALVSGASDPRIAAAAAPWRDMFQRMGQVGGEAPAGEPSLLGLALLDVPGAVATAAYVHRVNVFDLAGFILRHVCEDAEFVEEGAQRFADATRDGAAPRPGFAPGVAAVHTIPLGPEAEAALAGFMETHAREAGFSLASLLRSLLEEDLAQATRDPALAAAVVVSAVATEETGRVGCWEGGAR